MGDKDRHAEYVRSLMTDEVLGAYHEAVKRFGSKDLVVMHDDTKITVFLREALYEHLKNAGATPMLLDKLSRPSSEKIKNLRGSSVPTFWFLVDIPGTEVTYCCAISAIRMVPGGSG